MDLFAIKCETCSALLKVRDVSAIGEVVECPRCRSFVEIKAPPGWKPPPPMAKPAPRVESDKPTSAPAPESKTSSRSRAPEHPQEPAAAQPAASRSARTPTEVPKHAPRKAQQPEQPTRKEPTSSESAAERTTANQAPEKPSRSKPGKVAATALGSMAAAGLDLESAASAETIHQAAESAGPFAETAVTAPAAKLAGLSAGKLIAVAGGALTLCIAVVAAIYFTSGTADPPADKPPIITPADNPPVAIPPRRSVYVALDEAWLPSNTQMLVSLQWSGLTRNAQFAWLQLKLQPAVGQEMEDICAALGLKQSQITRATWAVTNVAAPTDGDLWMIELSDGVTGQDDLLARAKPLDFELGAYRVHQFVDAPWTQPFAIVDRRKIITGDEATLRELASREMTSVASDSLQNLLKHVGVGRDMTVLADLHAVREAEVDLPAAWVKSWGNVGTQWDRLRKGADGVAMGLDFGNLLVVQVDFLASAANAHDVQISVDDLLAAADPWMTEELQSLQERLRDGEFNDRVARKISILVERGLDALSTSETGIEQVNDKLALVWIRTRTDERLSELASAAISSVPAWEARRLTAARTADQAQLQALMRGLRGYEKVSGSFPQGAAGTNSVPANRRLSWIAQLLPYYESQMDGWKDELSFTRPWNVQPNDLVARRPLQAVINPAIGIERTPDGYPVTHYVGVAGWGADAATLPAGDERAGVFGYDRKISFADLQGHASQTMAIAGVSGDLGPWAEGGKSTVRGFSQEPYINGPDGFGSGQDDGMFAAMADASVRFINKDIDPKVLRQLAVVGGPKPEPPAVAVIPDRGNPPVAVDPPGGNNGNNAANNNANVAANIGPPPNADVHRNLRDRLAYPLQGVNFKVKPLQDVVDFLSNISGLPIAFDVEQMAAAGATPEMLVTINLKSTNVGEVLDRAFVDLSLKYAIDGDKLLVTAAGSGPLAISQQSYELNGLASSDEEIIALEEMLHAFVTPQAWDVANGPAALGVAGNNIVVNHTRDGHAEVAQFLGRLRIARGLAGAESLQAKTWLPVKLETLRQRSAVARAMPVTVNYFQPTPLLRVVANLAQKAQVEVLVDAPAMRAAGVEISTPVDLKAANANLESALQDIAQKLGLTVQALDDRTLQLTSVDAAAADTSTEFFPVAELLNASQTPETLAAGIRALAPENADALAVRFDAASGHMIVRAPQSQLFAIEAWLDSLKIQD